MNKITLSLLMAALLVGPAAAFAATYSYVDTSGAVRMVSADNASAALAGAVGIAPHSGVMLVNGTITSGAVLGASTRTYWYVDVNGNVRTVVASDATDAFNRAVDIAPHSGVMAR